MIVEPERYLEDFAKAGADTILVHQEACPHLHRTVQQIKSLGSKAGVGSTPPRRWRPWRRSCRISTRSSS